MKGHLSEGPEKVIEVFEKKEELLTSCHLLSIHAEVFFSQDGENSYAAGMQSRINTKYAEVISKISWINPELLALSDEKLKEYKEFPGMKPYLRSFEEIIRYKPHTLSAPEESLIAASSDALNSNYMSYYKLINADLTFGMIENEKGEKIELSEGTYSSFLESKDRNIRKKAWNRLYEVYIGHKNCITSMLDGFIKGQLLQKKLKKYNSCLEQSLFKDNIPTTVYTSLIDTVHKYIPFFHKYLSIRQRVLKIDCLDMCDLYVPLVSSLHLSVPYETACEWVLEALKPLGEEYCNIAREGLIGKGKWVDVFPNKGKRTNPCSFPNYGGKEYLLLCHNNSLDDVFTIAHELGHSMHSYYTVHNQPFRYMEYSNAVSEVASTFNEGLLYHYLLNKAVKEGNKEMEIYLINNRCDFFKGTLIRQVQFAEFELKLYEMAEKGVPLTPESMSTVYKEINDLYYGDCSKEGNTSHKYPHVMKADPRIAFEYLRIPHFFYDFYVYQYATSCSVAEAFLSHILNGEKDALEKYFGMLKVWIGEEKFEWKYF